MVGKRTLYVTALYLYHTHETRTISMIGYEIFFYFLCLLPQRSLSAVNGYVALVLLLCIGKAWYE